MGGGRIDRKERRERREAGEEEKVFHGVPSINGRWGVDLQGLLLGRGPGVMREGWGKGVDGDRRDAYLTIARRILGMLRQNTLMGWGGLGGCGLY